MISAFHWSLLEFPDLGSSLLAQLSSGREAPARPEGELLFQGACS